MISSDEKPARVLGGGLMLTVNVAFFILGVGMLVKGIQVAERHDSFSALVPLGLLLDFLGTLMLFGYFTLQPNEGRVMILFGSYHGTVRKSGFFWANPFYSRVRARIPLTGSDAARENAAPRPEG